MPKAVGTLAWLSEVVQQPCLSPQIIPLLDLWTNPVYHIRSCP